MREERVLGAYCGLGGGRIYLDLMGSLETGTAESTLYHEQCHGWLGRTTELGFLQAALEMEAWLAEDEPYHRALLRWVQFLTEKTRTVQEVFATNMELLKVWGIPWQGGDAPAVSGTSGGLPNVLSDHVARPCAGW